MTDENDNLLKHYEMTGSRMDPTIDLFEEMWNALSPFEKGGYPKMVPTKTGGSPSDRLNILMHEPAIIDDTAIHESKVSRIKKILEVAKENCSKEPPTFSEQFKKTLTQPRFIVNPDTGELTLFSNFYLEPESKIKDMISHWVYGLSLGDELIQVMPIIHVTEDGNTITDITYYPYDKVESLELDKSLLNITIIYGDTDDEAQSITFKNCDFCPDEKKVRDSEGNIIAIPLDYSIPKIDNIMDLITKGKELLSTK